MLTPISLVLLRPSSLFRQTGTRFLLSSSSSSFIEKSSLITSSSSKSLILLQLQRISCRYYAVQKQKPRKTEDTQIEQSRQGQDGSVTLSMGEKVKENVKTSGYGVVLLAGIAITGGLLYVVLSELFSGDSPNNIYTHAFKLCKLSQQVQDALGTPIKCYGEETRRGWRRHVSHVEFFQGNIKYLRMKFYIEGPFGKATVNVEKKKGESGSYEYSYVLVDVDYPPRRINVHF